MKKYILGLVLAACAAMSVAHAKFEDRYPRYDVVIDGVSCHKTSDDSSSCINVREGVRALVQNSQLAQLATTTTGSDKTTTVETNAPVTSTTVVKGGGIAAAIIEWMQVAFGMLIGSGLVAGIVKGMQLMGIQVSQQMRAQLQAVVINGLNDAAEKAKVAVANNRGLDIEVRSKIIADAIDYTQRHAPDTIKALGLDPKSGEAVEAIRARIETALNDPKAPTPPVITPPTGQAPSAAQPLAPVV